MKKTLLEYLTLLFALLHLQHIKTVAAQSPTSSTCGATVTNETEPASDDDNTCSLYLYDNTWLLAGRNYARAEIIAWPHDVTVNFTQHSRRPFCQFHRHETVQQQPQPLQEATTHPFHYRWHAGLALPWWHCHQSWHNVEIIQENHDIFFRTTKIIPAGEPLFMDCHGLDVTKFMPKKSSRDDDDDDDDDSEDVAVRDFPLENWQGGDNLQDFFAQTEAFCLDSLFYDRLEDKVVAKFSFAAGNVISFGAAMHFHKQELFDATTQQYETDLLSLAWGHADTNLILLSTAPLTNRIPHYDDDPLKDTPPPNVRMEWAHTPQELQEILYNSSRIIFAREEPKLFFRLVASRDIERGQALVLPAVARDPVTGIKFGPNDMFPAAWLAQERKEKSQPFPTFDTPALQSGQVQPALIKADGRDDSLTPLAPFLHRVGLPPTLPQGLKEWGQETGLLQHLERYVTKAPLEALSFDYAGDKFRVGGANWHATRFSSPWKSDMHYITPDDDLSTESFFRVLHQGGFDQVLKGIGEYFGLEQLTAFYPSFIAVSHCVQANMHPDSDHEGVFNLIFPIVQVNGSDPELILGQDLPGEIRVPYAYEQFAGILLGKGAMHGTAPCDYRHDGQVRIVVSVYLGDFSDPQVVKDMVDDWNDDPPYPDEEHVEFALTQRVHWSRKNPHLSIGNPLPPLPRED